MLLFREDDGCNEDFCYFNTALAFDRKGQIIAKYNKYNLYGAEIKVLSKPLNPQVVRFETDFGATIGLLICFSFPSGSNSRSGHPMGLLVPRKGTGR